MPLVARPHPPALPHGDIREVLPGVHFVTGTLGLPGPLPMRFSRNMTILREGGDRLVLVNSVRLDDAGLAALDVLGKVTDIVRIAGNHGMDDPFYRERYKAKVWVLAGQRYTAGFDVKSPQVYLEPDVTIDDGTALPIAGARVYRINSTPPEGILVVERDGGTLVTGDALQHWAEPDPYFSFLGKVMMKLMGFVKPHNVGPAWLKQCRPPKSELRGILDLTFANVLPAHGSPVLGGARDHYRPAIERAT
jgi:glyoxylase-like metal-dependent hydrolase (beta-lactamase superfamily II)